jgi:hypothetical protein
LPDHEQYRCCPYFCTQDSENLGGVTVDGHKSDARCYFYPLISDFLMCRVLPSGAPSNLPVARPDADQAICLPIYPALARADQERIIGLVGEARGIAASRPRSGRGRDKPLDQGLQFPTFPEV